MPGDIETAFSSALQGTGSAAGSSPESTPATETPTDAAPAAAETETTPPASASVTPPEGGQPPSEPQEAPPQGEPPKWRWQDILANARETSTKAGREAALRELGLEATANPEEVRQAIQFAKWLDRDPAAATAWLQQQVPQAPVEQPEPQPDAAIQTPDGRRVPVFSPEGLKAWQAWHEERLARRLEQSLGEKFKPALTMAEQMQQAAQRADLQQRSEAWATQTIAPLAKSPYFEEFRSELHKVVEDPSIPDEQVTEALHTKFWELHDAKLKALQTTGKSEALAELQTRALAGDTNSAAGTARTPKKYSQDEEGFAAALTDLAGSTR